VPVAAARTLPAQGAFPYAARTSALSTDVPLMNLL